MKGKQVKGMEYELTALKEFETGCEAKKEMILHLEAENQRADEQQIFFARTLLAQEAEVMMERFDQYMVLVEESDSQKDITTIMEEIDDAHLRREFMRERQMGQQLSKYHNSKLGNIHEQILEIIDLCFVDEDFDVWKQEMLKKSGKLLMLPDIFRLPHITDDMKKVLRKLQDEENEVSFYELLLDVIAAVKTHKENLEKGYRSRQKRIKEKYKESLQV